MTKEILLTRGKFTVVDEGDFRSLSVMKWHCSAWGYAIRFVRRKCIWMHREIIKPPAGMFVDHINGDKLDNRRENLRIVTHAQNCRNTGIRSKNTSGIPGVSFHKKSQKWRAYLVFERRQIELGIYSDINDAIAARNKGAEIYFGEYAPSLRRSKSGYDTIRQVI